MAAFRVSTVDDEAMARQHLRRLISLDAECSLAGEYSSGVEAIRSVEETAPDILFVDVHMPEMDGFDVVRALGGRSPLVILTSVYGEHAVRAFEAQVFDYLLKPFGETRFREALGRAKAQVGRDRMIESAVRIQQSAKRIAVRQNGRVVLVTPEEIDWIEAADNYICLHCGDATHAVRETISDMEGRLDPARFVRVHRSAIVNIDRIKELQPWFRGDYRVILVDGTELKLTKSHLEKLDSQLLVGSLIR